MRKLAAICAVTMLLATLVALRWKRMDTVSAATASNLTLVQVDSPNAGCALGPGYTFCDEVVGAATPASVFTTQASTMVSGVGVSFVAIPGLASNFAAGDFTITNNTCSGSLAANQQCQVSVEFSPTVNGLRAATLTVADSGGNRLAVNVFGTGTNLALAPPGSPCSPGNAWGFCMTPVGGSTTAATFTVVAGTAVSGISVSLAATPGLASEFASGDFAPSTGCSALNAGATCAVNVEFTPTTAGLRAATLTVTDSSGDSTSVYLAGSTTSGLAFENPQPSSNSSPCARVNLFGFCNEPSGGTTATKIYTLMNPPGGTTITGLTITPPVPTNPPQQPAPPPSNFTPQSTTCTPTLDAGASCTINVAFTPQRTGLLQGAVTVTNAQGDVAAINLAGVGDNYSLSLASAQPQVVTIEQGQTATFNAQVTADSIFGMNGEMVTFACPNVMPNLSTCAFPTCPVSVTPNGMTSFTIVIVTSSKTISAPAVTNPCGGGSAANLLRQPIRAIYAEPGSCWNRGHFPPLALIAIVVIGALGFGGALLTHHPERSFAPMLVARPRGPQRSEARMTPLRMTIILALATTTPLIFVGCGGHGSKATTETPTGTYPLTITGNAVDANGNAVNASRPLSFTLDVVTGK